MTRDDLIAIAKNLHDDLKNLNRKYLYITAFFSSAAAVDPVKYPDRIIVEGIKHMSKTGYFTAADRADVNAIIARHCNELNAQLFTNDPGMHNAVITMR